MHCLPRIPHWVTWSPSVMPVCSVDQGENRLPTIKAVLVATIGGG
jgi:hypothetical protein